MTQIVGVHTSPPKNRDGIAREGLEPRRPAEHNYETLENQPRGVYVMPYRATDFWAWDDSSFYDRWEVAYVGPVAPDPLVGRAVVFLDHVPAEWVRLARKAAV